MFLQQKLTFYINLKNKVIQSIQFEIVENYIPLLKIKTLNVLVMKKILFTLLFLPLFVSCSSDDEDKTQDYTSFTLTNNSLVESFPNTILAYKVNNEYFKLKEFGDLKRGITSEEFIIEDSTIKELYVFTDYITTRRIDIVFNIVQNKKNNFIIPSGISAVAVNDKRDPTQYPQE